MGITFKNVPRFCTFDFNRATKIVHLREINVMDIISTII